MSGMLSMQRENSIVDNIKQILSNEREEKKEIDALTKKRKEDEYKLSLEAQTAEKYNEKDKKLYNELYAQRYEQYAKEFKETKSKYSEKNDLLERNGSFVCKNGRNGFLLLRDLTRVLNEYDKARLDGNISIGDSLIKEWNLRQFYNHAMQENITFN